MNEVKSISLSKKKIILSSFTFILLLVATIYIVFNNQNPSAIYSIIKNSNSSYLLCGLIAVFTFLSCEAFNIKILINNLGNKLTFRRSLKYAFIGFYFCAITPSASGGQPMQVYYMKKDGIKITSSSLALLSNMVIYKVVLLLYCLFIILFNSTLVKSHISNVQVLFIIGFLVHLATALLLLLCIFYKKGVLKLSSLLTTLLIKVRLINDKVKCNNRLNASINEFSRSAMLLLHKPKLLFYVSMVTIIQITALYSVPFFVYKSFGLSEYSIFSIISLQSILNTAVSTIPLPGAVGITEGGFMVLFKSFFPKQKLASAMLVTRGISFYVFVIISCVVTLISHLLSGKKIVNSKNLPPLIKAD